MAYAQAIDIGYSSLKGFGGEINSSDPKGWIMPSGVLPKKDYGLKHAPDSDSLIEVIVDGIEYVAGIPAQEMRLADQTRSLDENYTSSIQYKVLFYAALAKTGRQIIDKLVTGLPVRAAMDPAKVESLTKMMTGQHWITKDRCVHVRSVEVIPQPYGVYLAALSEFPDYEDDLCEELVLVGDPGLFSLDWIMITKGTLAKKSSSDSQVATSKVIEAMAAHILSDMGVQVSPEKIESAMQRGRDSLLVGGKRLLIADLAAAACGPVIERSMGEIRNSLRNLGDVPNFVVLGGGGSSFWEQAFKDAFPQSVVILLDNPVMAIARGYYDWAVASD